MNDRISPIRSLLSTLSVPEAWYSIIATHMTHTSEALAELVRHHPTFAEVDLLPEDALKGLSIGEIGVLYEFSLAHTNRDARKQAGQFFTPDDVAQFMTEQANTLHANSGSVWLDPCCGIGNLSYWLIKSQPNPTQFLRNNMLFMDIDPTALFIARALMCCEFGKENPSLFDELQSKFLCENYLDSTTKYDYCLANPPYARTAQDDRFATAATKDLYVYFLEKIVTQSKGSVVITPQSFTNSGKLSTLRSLLINNSERLDVYSFDNVPDSIFRGVKHGSLNTNKANSVRAGITVRERGNEGAECHIRTTPLVRWASAERKNLFLKVGELLSLSPLSGEPLFYKNYPHLNDLLSKSLKVPQLRSLIVGEETEWWLCVSTSPRYYITAATRDLSRTSKRSLYFATERDMKLAYVLINSSYMYWWWRCVDGGMSLSQSTIMSCPVPDALTTIDDATLDRLVELLRTSETQHLVVKRNAGKDNENIKHPTALIAELNKTFLPTSTADALLELHRNSDLL